VSRYSDPELSNILEKKAQRPPLVRNEEVVLTPRPHCTLQLKFDVGFQALKLR
jgi:hypothetical protein